jgi:hypothetical protein
MTLKGEQPLSGPTVLTGGEAWRLTQASLLCHPNSPPLSRLQRDRPPSGARRSIRRGAGIRLHAPRSQLHAFSLVCGSHRRLSAGSAFGGTMLRVCLPFRVLLLPPSPRSCRPYGLRSAGSPARPSVPVVVWFVDQPLAISIGPSEARSYAVTAAVCPRW